MSKEIDDILSVIDKSNPYASFLNESALSNVDGWLDTGSMVLNGIVSGSLFGGIIIGNLSDFSERLTFLFIIFHHHRRA